MLVCVLSEIGAIYQPQISEISRIVFRSLNLTDPRVFHVLLNTLTPKLCCFTSDNVGDLSD